MKDNNYLADYRRTESKDLSPGIGGWLRRRLDRKAVACGQRDRHALFLPRVFELIKYHLKNPTVVLEVGCGAVGLFPIVTL